MANRSNTKGGELERDIAKRFNTYYETDEFARTPRSGALMGLSNFAKRKGLNADVRKTLGSDLIVPDWFKYSVECKWYKDSPNHAAMIAGNESSLELWLGEACYDSINFELQPMLIFKTNNKGIFYAIPKHLHTFNHTHFLTYKDFVVLGFDSFEQHKDIIKQNGEDMLDTTFEWLDTSPVVQELLDNLNTQKKTKKATKRTK
jgi:hypothetical protein